MSLELLQKISLYLAKMCLEVQQNISLYLAENVFRTAAKYQLISGRKCVQNCRNISAHFWQKKMCLELLQIINLYLAENVFRIAEKYQHISNKKLRKCEKPSKGLDERPKNLNAT